MENEIFEEKMAMFRENLIAKLESYTAADNTEESHRKNMLEFVKNHEDCFERSQLSGHITGSCWLEDYDGKKFLLTRHKKLNLWLQLGGHADGDGDIIRVSMREAREESGLQNIELVSDEIFDLGMHLLPQWKDVPPHYHYDVRFLLRASNQNEKISMSDESTDLRWFDGELPTTNPQIVTEDLMRMLSKWKKFHEIA